MRKNFLLACLALLVSFVHAQTPQGGGGGNRPAQGGGAPIARVYGKVLDSSTGDPIPYASVVIKPMRKDSVAGGGLTRENGFFDIKGLYPGMYQLQVSFLGYVDTSIQIKLLPPNLELDAGNIRLRSNAKTLGEVTIVGEKQAVELAIDRRIYSVDRNLAATGGTAIDALKTIPAVSVDGEGNVELRNSAPKVFVDGKPSPLTLDQIPASEIEKVEIITNPSAKYEASAAGGIINIVLKKNKLPGIFSMLNLGAGTNNRYNGMASINVRQSPLAFSLSYNINQAYNPAFGYNTIERISSGAVTSVFDQRGINDHRRNMQFVRAGLDYDLNARNTISLSTTLNKMKMSFLDDQDFTNKLATGTIDYQGTRDASNIRNMGNITTQLDYRRTWPKAGKEWTSFVQYNYNEGTGFSDIRQVFNDANGVALPTSPDLIKSDGENTGNTIQFQTDFTNPLGENKKLEFGGRFQFKDNNSITNAFRKDPSGELVAFPLLSLKYAYEEIVSAAYGNYIGRKNKLGYQAGLRLETSDFSGRIPDTDSTFSYRFPKGFSNLQDLIFPSIFLTYTLKEGNDLQFNLARKLERPNFFQLMPFVWQQDNQSYRAGNPNLLPEFRYVSEVNYAITKKWGSLFSSVYGRYEDQPVTGVVIRATDGTESLINTFVNGESNVRFGFEENIKYKVAKNLDVSAGFNIFRNQIKASFAGQDLTNSGWNWDTRGAIEWRFIKNWVFQANGDYDAPRIIPQGRTISNYGVDLALKRNFNPLGSVTLQVNDLFNSRGRGQIFETDFYKQELWRRREVRFIQLSLQLRFGKPDATIFKKMRSTQRPSSGGGDIDF